MHEVERAAFGKICRQRCRAEEVPGLGATAAQGRSFPGRSPGRGLHVPHVDTATPRSNRRQLQPPSSAIPGQPRVPPGDGSFPGRAPAPSKRAVRFRVAKPDQKGSPPLSASKCGLVSNISIGGGPFTARWYFATVQNYDCYSSFLRSSRPRCKRNCRQSRTGDFTRPVQPRR